MTHRLKVRWAIAAAIAKATHIRIDDQKELRIANNSSNGKSVIVRDPNYPEKTIEVDLESRGLDSLKFWSAVPIVLHHHEPLVAYYELLCFNLAVQFSDEQGLVELGTIRRDIDTIVSGADISSIVTSYFDKIPMKSVFTIIIFFF